MSDLPIIDSHIHLYPEAEIPTLAWCTPDHALASERSVPQFDAATAAFPTVKGFILVETDRKSDLSEEGWELPLKEVAWFARVATGRPGPGEDFGADAAERCLALIPWAPVPAGPEALEKYIAKAKEVAGEEAWRKVKGFRYLLQDKPAGTMQSDEFLEGVKYLGRQGYAFEIGVDSHRRGKKQLAEAVELIDRAHEDVPNNEKTTFIISKWHQPSTGKARGHSCSPTLTTPATDHMCKPDLTIYNLADPGYTSWRTAIYTLSRCDKTYMQLSGGLSEMADSLRGRSAEDIFDAVHPWLGILLATFGPERLIFGSDWPIATVGIEGNAWNKWLGVVKRMCDMASLGEEKMRRLYAGTAIEAFGLEA